jgi:S1-C subfamily serine protease
MRTWLRRHQSILLVLAGMLFTLLVLMTYQAMQDAPQEISQDDIDAAVIHTLETKSLQSRAARAAEAVRQSVVSVRGYGGEPADPKAARRANREADKKSADGQGAQKPGAQKPGAQKPDGEAKGGDRPSGIGSGVVIVDRGIILTNLHVVYGMKRVVITFYGGSESEADLVSVHPENDLAVLRARTIPDDLPAATLGSSASLKPGDEVVAVGFPFGIGPSVSAGVVSGLNREFRSPQGQRVLTQLIQFDAAANPGNSGGPLVNMDGDVVGIVTAIYTPSEARTFIGIGFAATIAVAGSMVGISPF